MKTAIISIIILIVLILIVVGVAVFSRPNNDSGNGTPPVNGDGGGGNLGSDTYNVEIMGFAFNPPTLTIKQGDAVIWANQDSVQHTVTSDSGNELESELFGKGQTYSHTFDVKGTFNYHCIPHPNMRAKIIVE